ncbi:MAG: terminase family protein [Ignavibacteria bacterium]|nr:terminase family protein [Ignavibacteria bacterium]
MELALSTKLSVNQAEVYKDNNRYVVLIAGRRFGKTTLAGYIMRKWVLQKARGLFAYIAPTWRMARNIFWELFLNLTPKQLIKRVYKNSLELLMINDTVLRLYGAQNYDAIRGEGFDGVILDETKDVPREAWFEVVRPALSDKKGKALIIGTPQGRNDLLYDIYSQPNFTKYHYTTLEGGWVTPEEIEQARNELDERTFKQEYEAEFVDTTGLVYYAFSDANIVDYKWNPSKEIYMTWDFNVGEKPMSCILLQEDGKGNVFAFQEFIHINSNTFYTAKVAADWLKKNGFSNKVFVTGDFSGNKLSSSATRKDYEIILDTLKESGIQGFLKIRPVKSIKARVITLNSYFCNTNGERKLFVTPNCKRLIKDLQQVLWNENGITLDDRNPERTHPSDALSYYTYNFSNIKTIDII